MTSLFQRFSFKKSVSQHRGMKYQMEAIKIMMLVYNYVFDVISIYKKQYLINYMYVCHNLQNTLFAGHYMDITINMDITI